MRALCLAAGVAGFFAAPGLADDVQTILYRCERGVGIRATYINTAGTSHAVLFAEGRQAALTVQPTASGARYAAPQGTSGYGWWTKGPQASLAWFDAEKPEEVVLYMDCAEVEP